MLLRLEGVARSFGGRTLFRDVALTIHRTDRIGLVGPNGAGKTTLMKIAAGLEAVDSGGVTMPRGTRVAMLRQEIDPDRSSSVRAEVMSAFTELAALEQKLHEIEHQMEELAHAGHEIPSDLTDRYGDCRTHFELGGGFERESRVERILEGLGFDAERIERPLNSFSGGWLMRVELAKLLLASPDVLLLDEPTNHLDLPSIQWFEETVADYPGAVVIISHDRTFLRRHVNRVAELEGSGLTVFDGDFDRYVEQKALRREELVANKRTQDRKIAQTERFIERFRAKNTKAKQVQSRVKALNKLERVELADERISKMRLKIPPVTRAGRSVLSLEGIQKSYDDTVVYEGVDLSIERGNRVALVGPNGAGKSTMLRIAAGVLPFDAGERTLGHNVTVAFFAQHQLEVLDPRRSALEELEAGAMIEDIPRLRGHLGAFLFSGDDVKKKVSVLSGGEKSRLALAKLLLRPANFLVLDEPTNHLDLTSREVLEDALIGYGGTLLLISHDRAFLNALVNRVVEVDHGQLREYPGNYDDYLRKKTSSAPREPAAVKLEPPQTPTQQATTQQAAPQSAAPLSKQERIAARERERELTRRHKRATKRLAAVEEEIRESEARLEEIAWRLGDPEVHRNPDAIREVEAERDEIRGRVDELYREWERLAAEVEAGEQGMGG
ncbi:MAG: ABC-F family ATP-binding cassette domain-containing protein [Deltaproteobacteria bacterium]|nr:ABC-F family ATP-binding cassette domain-containing protein [Deltaproteobacteria bacterium]MBW2577725.1 ABC-F family ATP-binding cassette domain-containing protein [Deltaproteobacteria bacterium]MBW2691948.1 ABC-F family ATP-binding cassette domain-containing protein [Deltaproteobacteria bacterium]